MAISESLKPAINELEAKLADHLKQAAETKKAINLLYVMMGLPPAYEDVQEQQASAGAKLRVAPDQYFRKSISVAAREYLRAKGEAATVDEIIDALRRGGCELGAVPNRNIRIALSKNSNIFVSINEDTFGLWEKYGGRPKQPKNGAKPEDTAEPEPDAGEEEDLASSAEKAEDSV